MLPTVPIVFRMPEDLENAVIQTSLLKNCTHSRQGMIIHIAQFFHKAFLHLFKQKTNAMIEKKIWII